MLRAALPADAPGIGRAHVISWRATYPGLMPASYLAGLRADDYAGRWRRIIEDPAHRSLVFVVEEDGEVAGFASGGRQRDGDPRYRGELYAIYLVPEAQGRGHGRALVKAVAGALAGLGLTSMVVWVLRDNAPARRFYEHLGGAYLRERPTDFGAGFTVVEVAYVWEDVRADLAPTGDGGPGPGRGS